MRRKKEDRRAAFNAILERNHKWIMFWCVRIVGERMSDLDDVRQELVLRLLKRFAEQGYTLAVGRKNQSGNKMSVEAEERLQIWNISRSVGSSYRKKLMLQTSTSSLDAGLADSIGGGMHADALAIGGDLERLLSILEETDRTIILMNVEGFKNKEIAKRLGMTPEAVAKRLQRIRERLKEEWDK